MYFLIFSCFCPTYILDHLYPDSRNLNYMYPFHELRVYCISRVRFKEQKDFLLQEQEHC
jgi:hypothetical protein